MQHLLPVKLSWIIILFPSRPNNLQWNQNEVMHFFSLVSSQMLSQTPKVCMQDALYLKVRNGLLQNGFMWTHLIRWLEGSAVIIMKTVKSGLTLENALVIPNIWLDLQVFLATAWKVARHVRTSVTECFPDSTWYYSFFRELYCILFHHID